MNYIKVMYLEYRKSVKEFSMLVRWVGLVSSSFAVFAAAAVGADEVDPACVALIKSAGHVAWQEAVGRLDNIDFVCHRQLQIVDLTHSKPTVTSKSDLLVSMSMTKKRWLIDMKYTNGGKDGLHVLNEDYKFTLARDDKNRKNGFTLASASKHEGIDKVMANGDGGWQTVRDIVEAPYLILGSSLDRLLSSPDFHLDVARFIGGGENQGRPIRLEWSRLVAFGDEPKGTRYWAELAPENSWLIKRSGSNNPLGVQLLNTIEYQSYGNGYFPKNITSSLKIGSTNRVETASIDPPHPSTRAEDEFYLPHYGITESVVDVTKTNTWVKVAAVVLSLVGVVAAIYFYRLSKKSPPPGGENNRVPQPER